MFPAVVPSGVQSMPVHPVPSAVTSLGLAFPPALNAVPSSAKGFPPVPSAVPSSAGAFPPTAVPSSQIVVDEASMQKNMKDNTDADDMSETDLEAEANQTSQMQDAMFVARLDTLIGGLQQGAGVVSMETGIDGENKRTLEEANSEEKSEGMLNMPGVTEFLRTGKKSA